MADPAEQRSSGGLSGALSQLAASVIGLMRTRFELATLEFEEERERTKEMLVLIVVATVFLSFALIVFSVLVVALFWQTYPMTAIVCVMLVYAAIGAVALIVLRRRAQERPFGATLSELEKDADWFRGRR